MERKKYLLIIFFLFFVFQLNATYKEKIYEAYVTGNMIQWKATIDRMNLKENKTNAQILEMVNYQYGYIAWCIGHDKKDEAKKYLENAEKNIEILEKSNYSPSNVSAYKSAFYGFKIGINMLNAPTLGPKSIELAELSLSQDKNNWFANLHYGNAMFYMPKTLGGSKSKALNYYLSAQKLMEKNTDLITGNWNYLSLLTTIAQTYTELGKYDLADSYYKKILSIEPNFKWVKEKLYPEMQKKQKNV